MFKVKTGLYLSQLIELKVIIFLSKRFVHRSIIFSINNNKIVYIYVLNFQIIKLYILYLNRYIFKYIRNIFFI